MMELSCAATAARRLSPWRVPSTPRLDAWIVPRPRRDSPRSRPHHGSQTEALSRQRLGRGRLRPQKNAIIPQNCQIVPISPRTGQGAVAAVHGGMGVTAPCPGPVRPADSPDFSTTRPPAGCPEPQRRGRDTLCVRREIRSNSGTSRLRRRKARPGSRAAEPAWEDGR